MQIENCIQITKFTYNIPWYKRIVSMFTLFLQKPLKFFSGHFQIFLLETCGMVFRASSKDQQSCWDSFVLFLCPNSLIQLQWYWGLSFEGGIPHVESFLFENSSFPHENSRKMKTFQKTPHENSSFLFLLQIIF